MRLYYSPASPYARKVLVHLAETGQTADVEVVHATGTPLDASKMPTQCNPLGKIPALELADGTGIYDSRVICRYFDDRKQAGLYGKGDDKWAIQTLEATADGILDAAILMVYEGRVRPEDKQFPDYVEAQWGKISRTLDALESHWIDILPWDVVNAGTIATGCALGYLDFRHGTRDWRISHPKLADWYAEFNARDSMQATAPVG